MDTYVDIVVWADALPVVAFWPVRIETDALLGVLQRLLVPLISELDC